MSELDSIVIREVGSNPSGGPDVQRVDMSKTGLFQRIGKSIFRSDNKAAAPVTPQPPRLSTAEELAELEPRLLHYERQFAAARKNVELGHSTPIQGGGILARKQQYSEWLMAGKDIASEPWIDASFLASILDDHQGGGLIPLTRERIGLLERQQSVNTFETENDKAKHKALVRLAKAVLEIEAAYEGALPFFRYPLAPCLKGIPTDMVRSIHRQIKHVGAKAVEDLV